METPGSPGPSTDDDDGDLTFDELVARHEAYIRLQAQKYVFRIFGFVEGWKQDVDDVVQQTLFQLWLAYRRISIENFRAYARQIVRNETINLMRRYKRDIVQRLQKGDDGEIYLSNQIYLHSLDESSDPQSIVERQERQRELMVKVGDAVVDLPDCQREAMVCKLWEEIDEGLQIIEEALRKHGLETNKSWPEGKKEKQRLQSSLSPARRKLKRLLEERGE
jgi:RNA polymerase sigma factor (sigma-70 family)